MTGRDDEILLNAADFSRNVPFKYMADKQYLSLVPPSSSRKQRKNAIGHGGIDNEHVHIHDEIDADTVHEGMEDNAWRLQR